ncbi:VWA domain-containing protein [Nocardioides sp. NPDC004968]|uniref:VWA domain-containing protein n=1 Tax=Nocardioides sp. NPDC004968 TaxID=3155894 RepID=UPI0033B78250
MDLRWPVLGAIVLVLTIIAIAAIVVFAARVHRRPADAVLVAHTARLKRLPRFRELATQQRWLSWWQTAGIALAVIGCIWLIARPQATDITQNRYSTRDIVLCLDASTSMFDEDTQVTQAYSQLVAGLNGERVSLVLWSDAAVTVFPLTDDYGWVQDELARAGRAFALGDQEYVAGTYLGKERASLISDGIVSCVKRFDLSNSERGRAVIVASDNDPQGGPPVYTLPEATEFAKERDVQLYGIGSADLSFQEDKRATFDKAVTDTGGTFSLLGDDGSIESILAGIDRLSADEVIEPPKYQIRDAPGWPIATIVLGVLMLIAGWVYALVRSGRLSPGPSSRPTPPGGSLPAQTRPPSEVAR